MAVVVGAVDASVELLVLVVLVVEAFVFFVDMPCRH